MSTEKINNKIEFRKSLSKIRAGLYGKRAMIYILSVFAISGTYSREVNAKIVHFWVKVPKICTDIL